MITLEHKKVNNENDRYKWFVKTKYLTDVEGYDKIPLDYGTLAVKFVNFNNINKNWLDGDLTDTMDLVNPNIKCKIKLDSGYYKLFVTFPEDAKCKWL